MRSIPRPAAPDKPLTAQEHKKRSRANWWYYNWGIVAVAAMVIVGVAYVAHGLLTTVDPDYTVAVSYTHLDVYKRQPAGSATPCPPLSC